MKRAIVHLFAILASIALVMGGTIAAASAVEIVHPDKVWVCKYVGTPGVNERLQTGTNPIVVSVNAIQQNQWDGITMPAWFSDKQDRSYVLDYQYTSGPYDNTGKGNQYTGDLTCPAPDPGVVTPLAPSATAPTCTTDGTLVIPTVTGVIYKVKPKFDGPGDYTITAKADDGYVLAEGRWVWKITVLPQLTGKDCVVEPVNPTVVQSPACNVQGTYTIPDTTGVVYFLNDEVIKPGTYNGPITDGLVTAEAASGYSLGDNVEWSFTINIAGAAVCTPPASPNPPNPQASIVTVCGHATFTLSNLTPLTTDESATFVTTINGKDSTQAVVKAGDTQTLDYSQTTDVGVVHLGVKSNGVVLASADMQTKCGQGGGTTKPPTTTPVEVAPAAAELPHTGGGNALPFAIAGLALMLLGAPVVWFATRKA